MDIIFSASAGDEFLVRVTDNPNNVSEEEIEDAVSSLLADTDPDEDVDVVAAIETVMNAFPGLKWSFLDYYRIII